LKLSVPTVRIIELANTGSGDNQSGVSFGGLVRRQARKVTALSFRAVNRPGYPGHDPGLQRHHILPVQLLGARCFSGFFGVLGRARLGFDDFRRNGLLLPACDRTARIMALPLHRGPHNTYNAMVMERVGQIEETWSRSHGGNPDQAGIDALFRLKLLQEALRRRLLDPRGRPISLNSRDPAGRMPEFSAIDAMADLLWAESEPAPQWYELTDDPLQDANEADLRAKSATAA